MTDLTWSNERRRLSDLVPWEHNPRAIRKAEAERLAQSLDEFGQIHPIAIAPDGTILDGHQRQQVWSATKRFGPDYEVDVRVASRPLTEREHQKLVAYLHAGAVGGWDWDALSGWDAGDLAAWGFDGELLKAWNDDAAQLALMLEADLQDEGDGGEGERVEQARRTLAERFVVPPFSVLDARQGYWQERKRAWLALGLRGELGRGDSTPPGGSLRDAASLGPDGKTRRGDGVGRVAERERERESSDADTGDAQRSDAAQGKVRRGYGRCFGQDLMRGEHVVGRKDQDAGRDTAKSE